MKEQILGVMAYPYASNYVIAVDRGDGRHIPTRRLYCAFYTDKNMVVSLSRHYVKLNALLQVRILQTRWEGR